MCGKGIESALDEWVGRVSIASVSCEVMEPFSPQHNRAPLYRDHQGRAEDCILLLQPGGCLRLSGWVMLPSKRIRAEGEHRM